MSDLVGNPEDRFSRVAAQMIYLQYFRRIQDVRNVGIIIKRHVTGKRIQCNIYFKPFIGVYGKNALSFSDHSSVTLIQPQWQYGRCDASF